MHTSYLSLAVFAIGATAAPSFPKPSGDPFAGSFPFFPSGSSSQSDEDSGLSNPVPAYMAAMEAVQSAQHGAYNTPQPSHAPNVAEELPEATNAPVTITPIQAAPPTPMTGPSSSRPLINPTPTPVMMSSFVSMASPSPTHRPVHSMGIHEGHLSSSKASATPSSSATPTPSPAASPDPGLLGLGPMVESVPLLGPMLGSLLGG